MTMNQFVNGPFVAGALPPERTMVLVNIKDVGTNLHAELLQQYPDGDLRVIYKGTMHIVTPIVPVIRSMR